MNYFLKGEEPVSYLGEMTREDQDMLKRLIKVNQNQLSQCEKRCYDLLVKVEKEISWDTLLKIKSATFLVESDNEQWENPFFNAQNSMTLELQSSGGGNKFHGNKRVNRDGITDESFVEIQNQADKFAKQRKGAHADGQQKNTTKIDTIAEEEKSDIDDSPRDKRDVRRKRDQRKSNLDLATVEDKQVTFVSVPSGGEDNEDEKSESDIVNEQTAEQDSRKKRLCFKIDKLFAMLFEDLNLLCEWENDEKKRGANDKT
jgi:hypothetical protein